MQSVLLLSFVLEPIVVYGGLSLFVQRIAASVYANLTKIKHQAFNNVVPAFVVLPNNVADVQAALQCATGSFESEISHLSFRLFVPSICQPILSL